MAKAFNNRGLAYRGLGEFEKAIAEFAAAIRLDSADAGTFVNRGATYHSQGELELAIADYTEAIRLDKSLADA